MWKISRKSKISRKPQKIDQTGKKSRFLKEALIVGLITIFVGLITGVLLNLVDKYDLLGTKKVSDPPPDPPPIVTESAVIAEVPSSENQPTVVIVPPSVVQPEKAVQPPTPEKTENIRLTVTTTETATESAFDDDVQITLTKVDDIHQHIFCKIMISSSGKSLSFKELTPYNPQKIDNYEINVVKIGHDYADFHIIKRQR